ncbi:MAG: bifunctional phosphoribosylaminoimidazolecarboxamide formyltransferase/IMP cyclohydrolase, partial [Bdellovibrionota bacterium]
LRPMVATGLRVVSTGGTLKHLKDAGIPAIDISEQTGFAEVMDGRVKTLHPRVHMALLARVGNAEDDALLRKEDLQPFDLVIVNLYPFESARNKGIKGIELIEYIDIGGPSMLRAAAKNFERAAVVCEPTDYAWITEKKTLSREDRLKLAGRVFKHTARYDDLIAKTFCDEEDKPITLVGTSVADLRYGENPHQSAKWFRHAHAEDGLHKAEILHGKALSYNNLLDLDAAVGAVSDFTEPCAVAVKHGNPCGVGTESEIAGAVQRAIAADPVSVFGGIIALNRKVDLAAAEAMANIFLECIVAPGFDDAALERLKRKKDLRLLSWPSLAQPMTENQYRSVAGGYLVQSPDAITEREADCKIVGTQPSAQIWKDIWLAWKVCARLKSNAIAIAQGGRTLGLGMGQVNRVDAVEHAIQRMNAHHAANGASVEGAVLASDAFFPFPDSIDKAADAGIKWIVQPGGSIRDQDVFARAELRGVNLILTGKRHFRH